jgi:ribonuclease III
MGDEQTMCQGHIQGPAHDQPRAQAPTPGQYEYYGPPPTPVVDQKQLEQMLGFQVSNMGLFLQAFTHKSCASYEFASNERLEFIGDAVINLVTARWLFDSFPHEQEGFLTRLRTKLVSGKTLSKLAQHLRLDRFVQMNQRAMSCGWHTNPRIMEDCFEALMGALYLSEGLVVARQFLIAMYTACIDFQELIYNNENYKDQLMRYCQQMKSALPEYIVEAVRHQEGVKPTFLVAVTVLGKTGRGSGETKKKAQQEAARVTLRLLGVSEHF